MSTLRFFGIPYAPGCGQGRLRRGVNCTSGGEVLLLNANDLPSLSLKNPAGLLVIDGAPYSHAMIQWLGLDTPLVIINAQQARLLPADCYVQLDGSSGQIKTVEPETVLKCKPPPNVPAGQAVSTADGVKVYLNASVSSVTAANRALHRGAAAIGLLRSEYLQPDRTRMPDSGFYHHAFGKICQAVKLLPVTIRLLDLAPDKKPPWLSSLPTMQGPSGLQGVRLYEFDAVQQVVRAQITAIDQLAAHFDIRLLIPYVSLEKEFSRWRNIVNSSIRAPVAVGAMLETPAAVLDLENWLKQVDFISIGCNDLMQCLFAADRDLPRLRRYLNPYTPALLRFFRQAATVAGNQINKIQLCGLMPQWPGILPLLTGMGFVNYSVEPNKIPYLAQSISKVRVETMRPVIEQTCNASNAREVCEILAVPVWPEE